MRPICMKLVAIGALLLFGWLAVQALRDGIQVVREHRDKIEMIVPDGTPAETEVA